MFDPFISLCVQPSYAAHRAVINWQVRDDYRDGDFFIYRSENGQAPWVCINKLDENGNEIPIRNTFSYEDDQLMALSLDQTPHYRILLEHETGEFDSPIVGTYDRLTRSQYAGVYRAMKLELMNMRHDGVQVWHFIPLMAGEKNPNIDPNTKQEIRADCSYDEPSFGLPYRGGYGEPVLTYMSKGPETYVKQENGDTGMAETVIMEARLLAVPQPGQNHVIVQPESDTRWVILGNTIRPHAFRGIAVTAYTATLQQLSRADERYKLHVPLIPKTSCN